MAGKERIHPFIQEMFHILSSLFQELGKRVVNKLLILNLEGRTRETLNEEHIIHTSFDDV